jgi:formate dehydrogenase alpha subunit
MTAETNTTTNTTLIELTIDGKAVTGKPGDTVLRVARHHQIQIPTLCNHGDLEPYGGCRMCLVEITGMRGLTTACTMQITSGMGVRTQSPEIQSARRINLELLLADHPNECLTCEKNQACELQTLAAEFGIDRMRFRKTRPTLPHDTSNPIFRYDPNKCILCSRCVRTCAQLQALGAIDLVNRGMQTVVGCANQVPWVDSTCESCGECITRCPTGALAEYQRAPAPVRKVKTTCTFCGTGCGLVLGVRGNEIVSSVGDRLSPVNHGKLCVKGRYGNGFVNSPKRLTTPLIKRNGAFEEATWDEALDLITQKFAEYKGDSFAAIGGARCTNEDNYLVQKFARAVMHTNNVDNCARLCHAPTVTGLASTFGTSGGTNPLEDLDGAECIFVIGSNPTEAHPVAGVRMRKLAQQATVIVADPREIEMVRHADLWLPLRPGTDVALLMGIARVIVEEGLHDQAFIDARCENFDAFLQSLMAFDLETVTAITGVPQESIVQAARLYANAKTALITYSLGITEHSHGSDNVMALANLAMLTGNVGKPSCGVMPMRGQNNVQGACDMGCIPGSYQGYQSVANPEVRAKFEAAWGAPMPANPGLYLVDFFKQALTGNIKALYIMGMDPAYSISDTLQVHEAFRKAEFVVVQDIFRSGSAEFADVILPATSFAEKDGTFTNLERRVQRVRKAIEPVGDSRPDWWITCEIARRMGAQGFDFADPFEVLDEIARLTPYFSGLSFSRLEETGIQWPCPAFDHPGTPRLHVEKFNTPSCKGHFMPLSYRPPFEVADEAYPFILSTGRSLNHYHMAMTSNVPGLMSLEPEETVRINAEDAARLGITDGEMVKVSSRRGSLTVKAAISPMLQPGTVWMTFHFYATPTNVLLQQESLDPLSKTPEFKVTAVNIEKILAILAADASTEEVPVA